MKINRLIIVLILFSFSCGQEKEYEKLLTGNSWTIKKVENLVLNEVGPDRLNDGTLWTFKEDHTFIFETNDGDLSRENIGTWSLVGDS